MILFGLVARSSVNVRPAPTLAGHNVAGIVIGASQIASTRFTAVLVIGETPKLRETLVAVTTGDVELAGTFTSHQIASLVADGAQSVARAGCKNLSHKFCYVRDDIVTMRSTFAAFRIIQTEVPESRLATIATSTLDVGLAVAASGLVSAQ